MQSIVRRCDMWEKVKADWHKDKDFFRETLVGMLKVGAFVLFLGLLEGLIEFYL